MHSLMVSAMKCAVECELRFPSLSPLNDRLLCSLILSTVKYLSSLNHITVLGANTPPQSLLPVSRVSGVSVRIYSPRIDITLCGDTGRSSRFLNEPLLHQLK